CGRAAAAATKSCHVPLRGRPTEESLTDLGELAATVARIERKRNPGRPILTGNAAPVFRCAQCGRIAYAYSRRLRSGCAARRWGAIVLLRYGLLRASSWRRRATLPPTPSSTAPSIQNATTTRIAGHAQYLSGANTRATNASESAITERHAAWTT